MNDFDQAARFVAEAEPTALVTRLLADTGLTLTFNRWFPTGTVPRTQSPERIADLVAVLDDPTDPERPWLLVIEIQSRPEARKILVLLEESAIFASRARWGDDRTYRVLPALVHLTGRADPAEIDMRTPNGYGLLHRPIVWDLPVDDAGAVLDRVSAGELPAAMLFWLPLMNRGGEEIIVKRWREAVFALVPDEKRRDQLREVALAFAELARNVLAWEQGLEGWKMGESQIMNRWREEAATVARLQTKRKDTLELLDIKFPGAASADVRRVIEQQASIEMLDDWFRALARATTYDEFYQALRQ
jgi:hypothetical protein